MSELERNNRMFKNYVVKISAYSYNIEDDILWCILWCTSMAKKRDRHKSQCTYYEKGSKAEVRASTVGGPRGLHETMEERLEMDM